MVIEIGSDIDELLRLTEEMCSLAAEGEWEAVEMCEARRIAVIGSSAPVMDDADGVVAAKLKQILDKNTEILALAVAGKAKIANELRQSKSIEKASQAYLDVEVGQE